MPSWLSNLLPPQIRVYATAIKYGLIALSLLVISGGSYYAGYHHEKVRIETQTVEHVVTQIKNAPAEDAKIVVLFKGVKLLHDQTIQQIPYVIDNAADCNIGPDTIRLLNTNRGSVSAVPANDGFGAAAATNQ